MKMAKKVNSILETVIFLVLITSYFQCGLLKATSGGVCTPQQASVCNMASPPGCDFEKSNPSQNESIFAINRLSFLRVTILHDHENNEGVKRYMKVEWERSEEESTEPLSDVIVCASALAKGYSIKDELCVHSKGKRNQSVILRLHNDATDYLLDIGNLEQTEMVRYWVKTAKMHPLSWMAPVVSISTFQDRSIVSVSAPKTNHLLHLHYTVTYLACLTDGGHDYPPLESGLGLPSDMWGFGNCSNVGCEMNLNYDKTSQVPIILSVQQRNFRLLIDVSLVNQSGYKIKKTSLKTPNFGVTDSITDRGNSGKSLMFPWTSVPEPESGAEKGFVNTARPYTLLDSHIYPVSTVFFLVNPTYTQTVTDDDSGRQDNTDKYVTMALIGAFFVVIGLVAFVMIFRYCIRRIDYAKSKSSSQHIPMKLTHKQSSINSSPNLTTTFSRTSYTKNDDDKDRNYSRIGRLHYVAGDSQTTATGDPTYLTLSHTAIEKEHNSYISSDVASEYDVTDILIFETVSQPSSHILYPRKQHTNYTSYSKHDHSSGGHGPSAVNQTICRTKDKTRMYTSNGRETLCFHNPEDSPRCIRSKSQYSLLRYDDDGIFETQQDGPPDNEIRDSVNFNGVHDHRRIDAQNSVPHHCVHLHHKNGNDNDHRPTSTCIYSGCQDKSLQLSSAYFSCELENNSLHKKTTQLLTTETAESDIFEIESPRETARKDCFLYTCNCKSFVEFHNFIPPQDVSLENNSMATSSLTSQFIKINEEYEEAIQNEPIYKGTYQNRKLVSEDCLTIGDTISC